MMYIFIFYTAGKVLFFKNSLCVFLAKK